MFLFFRKAALNIIGRNLDTDRFFHLAQIKRSLGMNRNITGDGFPVILPMWLVGNGMVSGVFDG